MSRWFRHYAGMMRDEKLVKVAVRSKQTVERVVWVWGAILESAAEINDGGRYEFDPGEAAYFLRCDEADILCVVECLESVGRLHAGVVTRWSDRQFDSDSSKERQRRYRERLKAGDELQQRNGDVGTASRDGRVTLQDTDTDTSLRSVKTEKEKREREKFADWFNSWPSAASDDEDEAFAAWLELSEAERADASKQSSAYVIAAKGGGRTAICAASKYLRKRMWTRLEKIKPPGKPPPKTAGLTHLTNFQSRAEYLAAEKARSERSFQR